MRGLLSAVILVLLAVVVSRMLNTWRRTVEPRWWKQRDELVKDPVCQTYVVLSRAVTAEVDGMVTHFCSRECAERFVRGQRRR